MGGDGRRTLKYVKVEIELGEEEVAAHLVPAPDRFGRADPPGIIETSRYYRCPHCGRRTRVTRETLVASADAGDPPAPAVAAPEPLRPAFRALAAYGGSAHHSFRCGHCDRAVVVGFDYGERFQGGPWKVKVLTILEECPDPVVRDGAAGFKAHLVPAALRIAVQDGGEIPPFVALDAPRPYHCPHCRADTTLDPPDFRPDETWRVSSDRISREAETAFWTYRSGGAPYCPGLRRDVLCSGCRRPVRLLYEYGEGCRAGPAVVAIRWVAEECARGA